MTLLDILKQYRVTSPYGYRQDPLGSGRQFHTGVDLVGKHANDPIESFTEGTVIYSGDTHPGTGLGGFGWVVCVKDGNGRIHLYAHLVAGSVKVKVGQHVTTGQILGIMGTTGKSTGVHLHYEVRLFGGSYGYGKHVNPLQYIEKLCKDGWTYYNRLKRPEMCDLMHETAEYLRNNLMK